VKHVLYPAISQRLCLAFCLRLLSSAFRFCQKSIMRWQPWDCAYSCSISSEFHHVQTRLAAICLSTLNAKRITLFALSFESAVILLFFVYCVKCKKCNGIIWAVCLLQINHINTLPIKKIGFFKMFYIFWKMLSLQKLF